MRTHKNDNTTIKVISSHNKHFDMEPTQTLGVKIYPSTTFNQVMSSYKKKKKRQTLTVSSPSPKLLSYIRDETQKKKIPASWLFWPTTVCDGALQWWRAEVYWAWAELSYISFCGPQPLAVSLLFYGTDTLTIPSTEEEEGGDANSTKTNLIFTRLEIDLYSSRMYQCSGIQMF